MSASSLSALDALNRRAAPGADAFSEGYSAPAPLSAKRRSARRAAAFAESAVHRLARIGRSVAAGFARDGFSACCAAVELAIRDRSIRADAPPSPDLALSAPDGLVGSPADFKLETLQAGYARGLLLEQHFGLVRWFAPAQRMIARIDDLMDRPASTLGGFVFDRDIETCLEKADFSPRLKFALARAFDNGVGHCFEAFDATGNLLAAGYGLPTGDCFSLVAWRADDLDSARAFLAPLARELGKRGYRWIEAGRPNARLLAMGFAPMARDTFAERPVARLETPMAAPQMSEDSMRRESA